MWLQNEKVEIYSTLIEGKALIAEQFITTVNNKIYNQCHIKKCVL